MNFVFSSRGNGIATLTLKRGKVNALNEPMVEEIIQSFESLETDNEVRSIIITGSGKFFSFGFDVPEFLSYPKEDFIRYVEKFTNLYTYMFQFPKPIVAALNGHTIAGGCMLAIACDYRLMVSGKAKISLNEITFGSSVFAGSAEMLKYCVGQRNAQSILYSGSMYSAEEALGLGLVDQVSSESGLTEDSMNVAQTLAEKSSLAFKSIKNLLRQQIVEEMTRRDKESFIEMAEIWYSESTLEKLKEIEIYS
ncbi:MAG: enoyl-CoA hydratase/isomerase family protein [Syntrophobacterales bacterium]|jgi:enoyl-CoA hydratase/carnithine racemase